ncbi:zinc finger protein RFP-like isoform X2 [Hemicordylus capensis]|nr:zinc finger protein RFP-like isoform X2 [Hemicordylus capensis]
MVKHGCTKNIKTVHHCITAMYEYENKSLEELRLEDYQVNRKGPWFGLSTATPSTVTGLFGSSTINTGAQNKTGFGTSFGTGSLFGQTMQISGLVFKPFGQDTAVQNTGFSSGNISIPGQLNTNTLANEGPVQNLYDEATCPICLEYFKKPVSVDCGHIFCRACITRCWKKSDTDASCPQCREPCQQRNLRPIRQLASIVEIAKKFSLQVAKGPEALGNICERHQEPLKLFCEDDQIPICVVCDKSKEHREHKVVPNEEAFEEYKGKIQSHLEFLRKKRSTILSFKLSVETENQNLLEQTERERQKIVDEFKQLHQFLEEQEHLLLAELKDLDDKVKGNGNKHIAKLSEEISSVDNLIKEIEEKQQQPAEFLQGIRSILQRCSKEKFVNPVAFPPGLKQQIKKFSEMHPFLHTVMKEFKDTVLSGPQEEKANSTDVEDRTVPTLDLTIPTLVLSTDHQTQQYYCFDEEPSQLCYWSYILGVERITSGCHSWMVEVGDEKFWAVGVAKEHLRGKPKICLSPKEGIWAIGKLHINSKDYVLDIENDKYYAFTSPGTSLGPNPTSTNFTIAGHEDISYFYQSVKPRRIRVSLNYEEGSVTFFDPDKQITIFSFNDVSFSGEKLCSWLSVGR